MTEDQLTLDDLLGFTAPPSGPSEEEKAYRKAHAKAARILQSWAGKSGRSAKSIAHAQDVFAQKIIAGVSLDDLRYILAHGKPMISGVKKITESVVDHALETLPEDKEAGQQSTIIFQQWYEEYYRERYTQSPGQITSCLKRALLSGIGTEELMMALVLLGKRQQTVSEASLQYSLAQVLRIRERTLMAGAKSGAVDEFTQREIFASRRNNLSGDRAYRTGSLYDDED